MGVFILIVFAVLLLSFLWLPMAIQLNHKSIKIFKVKYLLAFLIMPIVVVSLWFFASEIIGLTNPSGLLLAFTALTSISGYLYAKNIAV